MMTALLPNAIVDTAMPQTYRETKEHLEKISGGRCVDSRFQVELGKDGGGMTELGEDKWSVAHVPLGATVHE